ncbi:MAG: hypothetical protein ACI9F9_002960, partial [Candidatus Paceibacteria bacterium]
MAWFKPTDKEQQNKRASERVRWSPEASLTVQVVLRTGELEDVRWLDLS